MDYKNFSETIISKSPNNLQEVPIGILDNSKIVFLFFSCSQSPPCKTFLPKLIKLYKFVNNELDEQTNNYQTSNSNDELGKINDLEVLYISGDFKQDQHDYEISKMPWFSIPFNQQMSTTIANEYQIVDLPSVVILKQGSIICPDARFLIQNVVADGGLAMKQLWTQILIGANLDKSIQKSNS